MVTAHFNATETCHYRNEVMQYLSNVWLIFHQINLNKLDGTKFTRVTLEKSKEILEKCPFSPGVGRMRFITKSVS